MHLHRLSEKHVVEGAERAQPHLRVKVDQILDQVEEPGVFGTLAEDEVLHKHGYTKQVRFNPKDRAQD